MTSTASGVASGSLALGRDGSSKAQPSRAFGSIGAADLLEVAGLALRAHRVLRVEQTEDGVWRAVATRPGRRAIKAASRSAGSRVSSASHAPCTPRAAQGVLVWRVASVETGSVIVVAPLGKLLFQEGREVAHVGGRLQRPGLPLGA